MSNCVDGKLFHAEKTNRTRPKTIENVIDLMGTVMVSTGM